VKPKLQWDGTWNIPAALRFSHDEMRAGLVKATNEPGRIGDAAVTVARLCLPHFEQEEKAVFPVLSLLYDLAFRDVRHEMAAVLPLVSTFSEKHEALDRQHEAIGTAIEALLHAAHREGNREIAEIAYGLKVHEKVEDEVIYPAVMLVGKYVREKLDMQ
jgi:hypothetical protein